MATKKVSEKKLSPWRKLKIAEEFYRKRSDLQAKKLESLRIDNARLSAETNQSLNEQKKLMTQIMKLQNSHDIIRRAPSESQRALAALTGGHVTESAAYGTYQNFLEFAAAHPEFPDFRGEWCKMPEPFKNGWRDMVKIARSTE